MPKSMYHWNSNQMCVIDTETTGLDPSIHEIWQITILPLDSNLEVRTDVTPFDILMRPEHPENIDWSSTTMRMNKERIQKALRSGHDPISAIDLFISWTDRLGLPLNKGGYNRCKIIPLGMNYCAFDLGFILNWMGRGTYDEFFHYEPRDLFIVAQFINDNLAMQGESVKFNKRTLRWIATQMGITPEVDRLHDSLYDCLLCAQAYKKLLQRGMLV